MQDLVVHGFLGSIAEMYLDQIGGGADPSVQDSGILVPFRAFDGSDLIPSFLAVGRNPCVVDECRRQTESQPPAVQRRLQPKAGLIVPMVFPPLFRGGF